MTPTERKVDVLQVWDEVIQVAEKAFPTPLNNPGESTEHPVHLAGRLHDMREARAAVAELIEADKEYDKARRFWDLGCYTAWEGVSDETRTATATRFEDAVGRRIAALARVQGGQ